MRNGAVPFDIFSGLVREVSFSTEKTSPRSPCLP